MSDLFNPIEFGFKDFGETQFGHTYRSKKFDIRKVYDAWRGNCTKKILPNDDWKIKEINSNSYIFVGKIPDRKFALDLLTNLDCLPDEIKAQLKRDIALENLLN
jgi:hypothetical protein